MAYVDHLFLYFVIFGTTMFILPTCIAGVESTGASPGACLSQPCENGGICGEYGSAFVCRCPEGITGLRCETNQSDFEINACTTLDPCNGGICVSSGADRYTCMCNSGWQGVNCERDVDECIERSHACAPDSICVNENGTYFCQNMTCTDYQCQNGGTCQQLPESAATCTCPSGFEGRYCEIQSEVVSSVSPVMSVTDRDGCTNQLCQNGGVCTPSSVMSSVDFTCSCPSGFSGTLCEIPLHVVCLYDDTQYHEKETRFVDCNECYCQGGSWFCTTRSCRTIHGAFKFHNSFDTIAGREAEFSRSLKSDLIKYFGIPRGMMQDLRVSAGSIQVDFLLVSLRAQYNVKTISSVVEYTLSASNYSFIFDGDEYMVDPMSVSFEEYSERTLPPTDTISLPPASTVDTLILVLIVAISVLAIIIILVCLARICIRRQKAKAKAKQYQDGEAEIENNCNQLTTIQNHLYAVIDNSETYEDVVEENGEVDRTSYHTYEKPKIEGSTSFPGTLEYKELERRDSYNESGGEDSCCQLEIDILRQTAEL